MHVQSYTKVIYGALSESEMIVRFLPFGHHVYSTECYNMNNVDCRVVLSEAMDGCICFTRKIQHGGDWERSRPQGPKNVHNFLMTLMTSELRMRAWDWNVTDSKKTIFDLITPRYFPIWQSKEMSHDFYMR